MRKAATPKDAKRACAAACRLEGLGTADVEAAGGSCSFSLGAIAAPLFAMKGAAVKARSFATQFPLKHQQKDLRLAVQLADELGQATPIAAAANELYKQAKMVGEADSDMSAVYNAVNPAAK